MLIGELAGRVGVNVQTVRYYERKDLLPVPHRWPDTGHRDYDEEAVRQMRFIRSAKAAGFTLREIRELLDMRLLPGDSCGEVREMVEEKIEDLNRRLAEIKEMRRLLEQMAMACHDRPSARECPALWRLGGHR